MQAFSLNLITEMSELMQVLQGKRNNAIIFSMDKPNSIPLTIILCVIAELLNLFSAWILGDVLHIPLFMDTIGTVFIVFYAGLIPGLIVGGLYNILRLLLMIIAGNPFYPWEIMYSLCGISIVIFTWIFSWHNDNLYLSKTLTILYIILISLVTAFASSIIGGAVESFQRIFFDDQIYVNPVKSFVMAFLGENIGLFIACTFARIPVTILDRLICTVLGFILYKIVKSREASNA